MGIWKEIRFALIMGVVVPAVMLLGVRSLGNIRENQERILETVAQSTEPVGAEKSLIPILNGEGEIEELPVEDYLTGVMLAEMPASFELEALKAQAVVARTYTFRSWSKGSKHPEAAVCMDSGCCQGYLSEEDYLERGGSTGSIEKMRQAVQETSDYVLTYQGKLIEATYFSCSGGVTEDAVAVWGTEVPYLKSVDSPGEEGATHYTDVVTFTKDELEKALGITLTGNRDSWFGDVTYTAGGGVKTMRIGQTQWEGTLLRKKLGLRSTIFTMEIVKNKIQITTRGYGHRVGMSQYGADAMAVSGSTFEEILSHYYQGTELVRWESDGII